MGGQSGSLYSFGPFQLNTAEHLLLRGGEVVALTPKALDTLVMLVERKGHLVGREELLTAVWADCFVEEANLTVSISTLRKALGKQPDGRNYIETVPKRGYRFAAGVEEQKIDSPAARELFRSSVRAEVEETSFQDVTEPDARASQSSPLRVSAKKLLSLQVGGVLFLSVVLAVIIAIWWKSSSVKQVNAGAKVRSIAVLPFKQLSAEESNDYLGLGIADVLITRLGRFEQIVVKPTSAIFKYTDSAQDLDSAGQALKVESILEGSIHRLGDRLRLTARLVRVPGGELIWADTFDGKYADIFAIQDEMFTSVVRALNLSAAGRGPLLTKHYTQNTDAYKAYIKGRYFLNKRTEEGLKKAIKYFELAVDKDTRYAPARTGLADSHMLLGIYGISSTRESFLKAKSEAAAALAIDDAIAETHISLAYALLYCDWDWSAAEREFKRGIELNQNYATAHHWYSEYLAATGRFEEAFEEMKRAQELDPQSLIINTNLGYILYIARRYAEAIEELDKVLEMDPNFSLAQNLKWQCYVADGKYDEALALDGVGTQPVPEGVQKRAAVLREAYRASGWQGHQRMSLALTLEESKHKPVSNYVLAYLYTATGENDRAMKCLQRAFEDRELNMIWLKVDPFLDGLRADPRFTNLMARVGLL